MLNIGGVVQTCWPLTKIVLYIGGVVQTCWPLTKIVLYIGGVVQTCWPLTKIVLYIGGVVQTCWPLTKIVLYIGGVVQTCWPLTKIVLSIGGMVQTCGLCTTLCPDCKEPPSASLQHSFLTLTTPQHIPLRIMTWFYLSEAEVTHFPYTCQDVGVGVFHIHDYLSQ